MNIWRRAKFARLAPACKVKTNLSSAR